MSAPARAVDLSQYNKIGEWKTLGEVAEDVLRAYALRYKDEIKVGTAKVGGVMATSKASFR